MMDVLMNWGPTGPQPVSPLYFFDLRHYLAELIQREHAHILLPNDYSWSQESLDGEAAIIAATPINEALGLDTFRVRVNYVDLVDLLQPLLSDRVLDFSGEITLDRIVDRINAIAGVPLIKSHYFNLTLDSTGENTYSATLTPSVSNLLGVGVITANLRSVSTDVDEEFDVQTYPYTDMDGYQLSMCIMGSYDPLEPSDCTGNRTIFSDGSYIEQIDADTIEYRSGMLSNLWVCLTLPGPMHEQEIDGEPVNVILELVSLTEGEVNLHVDTNLPFVRFADADQTGEVIALRMGQRIGFNYNSVASPFGMLGAENGQTSRIRVRLVKEL